MAVKMSLRKYRLLYMLRIVEYNLRVNPSAFWGEQGEWCLAELSKMTGREY